MVDGRNANSLIGLQAASGKVLRFAQLDGPEGEKKFELSRKGTSILGSTQWYRLRIIVYSPHRGQVAGSESGGHMFYSRDASRQAFRGEVERMMK